MKNKHHLTMVSRIPSVAQSNFQTKMEALTSIIDRLLLVPLQSPWKAIGGGGGGGTTTEGTTTEGTTTTEGDTGL